MRDFVETRLIPIEDDPASYDEHENVKLDILEGLREHVKAAGLWAPQMPVALGGGSCSIVEMGTSPHNALATRARSRTLLRRVHSLRHVDGHVNRRTDFCAM